MAAKTRIGWTHATVNWWWGCTKISEACKYCYAATMDLMRGPLFDEGRVHWGPNAPRWVRTDAATLEAMRLNARAGRLGKRFRVFVNSMSDTFEDHEQLPAAREILFTQIERLTNLDFQLLTKRPENILKMVPAHWREQWPRHVLIGTTAENQEMADQRIPYLLKVPAAVRFLSCEPLLEAVNIRFALHRNPEALVCPKCLFATNRKSETRCPNDGAQLGSDIAVNWVIAGGESGSKARPMHPDWARSLRDQCRAASVPFFFKQWGEWTPEMPPSETRLFAPERIRYAQPDGSIQPLGMGHNPGPLIYRRGTLHTGNLLDGVLHEAFPETLAA